MLNIKDNISELYQKHKGSRINFCVELISTYTSYLALSITFIIFLSYFIGLIFLGILIACYDKSSYPAFEYLYKLLHGNYIYDFYYSYINPAYTSLTTSFGLDSNIAQSGQLSKINSVVATISVHALLVGALLSLVYHNLRLSFLCFNFKNPILKFCHKIISKCFRIVFSIPIGLSTCVAMLVMFYVKRFVIYMFYILIPSSVILSVISFFFGKIIFSYIGLAELGDLGLWQGIVFFASYLFKAIYYITFVRLILDFFTFINEDSETTTTQKPKTEADKIQTQVKIAGLEGENKFQIKLDKLKKKLNFSYTSSSNMLWGESWVAEIDFLLLVPNVGLVVVEVKNYSGKITCSNLDKWTRIKYDNYRNAVDSSEEANVSKQVITTTNLLKKILASQNINKWKIIPLVLFVNDKADITIADDAIPQTDVTTFADFEKWLLKQPKNHYQQFTIDDTNQINEAIEKAQENYKVSTNPKVMAIRNNEKADNALLGVSQ
jgi:hypothetical protein